MYTFTKRIEFQSHVLFWSLLWLSSMSLVYGQTKSTKPELSEADWKVLVSIGESGQKKKSNKVSPEIKKYLNRPVKVGGFMIANEFDGGDLKEFLLTPIGKGCIHVPPPPPNYVIHVKMGAGKGAKVNYVPVLVKGTITLADGYKDNTMFTYEMTAESVEDYPLK